MKLDIALVISEQIFQERFSYLLENLEYSSEFLNFPENPAEQEKMFQIMFRNAADSAIQFVENNVVDA